MKGFLNTTAGGYTLLIAVGVVGFLLIHRALRKDVTDTTDAIGNWLQHPLGQGFDDAVYDLFHPNQKPPADNNADLGGTNFGLTDPNNWQ